MFFIKESKNEEEYIFIVLVIEHWFTYKSASMLQNLCHFTIFDIVLSKYILKA